MQLQFCVHYLSSVFIRLRWIFFQLEKTCRKRNVFWKQVQFEKKKLVAACFWYFSRNKMFNFSDWQLTVVSVCVFTFHKVHLKFFQFKQKNSQQKICDCLILFLVSLTVFFFIFFFRKRARKNQPLYRTTYNINLLIAGEFSTFTRNTVLGIIWFDIMMTVILSCVFCFFYFVLVLLLLLLLLIKKTTRTCMHVERAIL